MISTGHSPGAKLKRSINLPLLVFYGLGTTIGAGIYVLVGAAAGYAGMYAPLAFLAAALGVAPTAVSYAELSGRMPVSAGEAAFVKKGFRSNWLAIVTGLLVAFSGLVAAATIAIGCAGYIGTFVALPADYLVLMVLLLMGFIAIWGILESVILTSMFTLIETGGLLLLIYYGFTSGHFHWDWLHELKPISEPSTVIGIMNAGVLAVFAFLGFETMVNIAEETKNPKKVLPTAMFLTLIITTVLYTLVTIISIVTIDPAVLAQSDAPLSDVFQQLTGATPVILSAIAVFATANTILVQFIMISRVLYGISKNSKFFGQLAEIDKRTRTPLKATLLVIGVTIILSLVFPLEWLATATAQIILIVWTLINISLILIKLRTSEVPKDVFTTPIWVPIVGALFSGVFLLLSFLG